MSVNFSISDKIFSVGGRILGSLGMAGASLGKLNWSRPNWDMFILLVFIAAIFLYGFTLGKGRIIVLLSSIYMACAAAETFPWNIKFNAAGGFFFNIPNKLLVFVIVLIFLLFTLVRSGMASIFRASAEGSWIEVLIFSVLQVGLLASAVISFFPLDDLIISAPLSSRIFALPAPRFFWTILPLAALALAKKKRVYSNPMI